MTVALLAAGAVLAAVGTRAAAVVFAAGAVVAAAGQGAQVVAGTWTAAMAAGLVVFGPPPRRVALAAAGAAAALVAGSATNGAVVLAAWSLGSLAVVLAGRSGAPDRRFAFTLLTTDLVFAAAVGSSALATGFVAWPTALDETARLLLLLAVVLRVPLIAGPRDDRPEAGLLVVRAQVLVGATIALGGSPQMVGTAGLLVGMAVFAVSGTLRRGVRSDAALESGLVVAAVGSSALGWTPAAWAWGAAAGGTLMHNLRLRVPSDGGAPGSLARAVLAGGGIGLPLLPAVAAIAVTAVGAGSVEGALVVVALVAGLAGRAWFRPGRLSGQQGAEVDVRARWMTLVAVALAVLVAVWAPLVAVPRPPGGDPVPWPPVWAAIAVVVVALAGLRWPDLAPARERRRPTFGMWDRLQRSILRPVDLSQTRGAIIVPLGLLAASAIALFVVGLVRGFL